MSKKLNRRARIYLIATVISVAIVSMGIALAYFAADIQGIGTTDLNVTVSSNPFLTFKTDGEGIALTVSVENFYEDGYDIAGTTSSTATLEADGSVVSATYNVYFNITENELDYSSENVAKYTPPEPELILVITTTDNKETSYVIPEGYEAIKYEIKNEDGTITEVEGIDITSTTGMLNVAVDHEITIAEGEEHTQEWSANVYFINLDVNQIDNSSKSFSAQFILADQISLSEVILLNNGGVDSLEELDSESLSKRAISQDAWDDLIDLSSNGYVYDEYWDQDVLIDDYYINQTGLYKTVDDYGDVYYFRGGVNNNWVKFAGYYWRIISIDEEGNVKMIYSGTSVETDDGGIIDTSSTSIGYTTFNSYGDYIPSSVGYMYTDGDLQGISSDSIIKDYIDDWYANNLKIYEDYLVEDNYCIDRTMTSTEPMMYYFAAYSRLATSTAVPSLKCSDEEDVVDELSLYVGLISADEVVFAGLNWTNYYYLAYGYLYTGESYWTLSPYYYYASFTGVFSVTPGGHLYSSYVDTSRSVRPVVTLASDIIDFTGSGTWYNPYYIYDFLKGTDVAVEM